LAFDSAGNLFVANGTIIDEFTPGGARSTFATGMGNPTSLAFDSTGNLYVSNGAIFGRIVDGIFEYTPAGIVSTFAPGYMQTVWLFRAKRCQCRNPRRWGC